MKCVDCGSEKVHFNGKKRNRQQYRCSACGSTKVPEGAKSHTPEPRKADIIKPRVGMSLNDFRSKYDVDYILRDTLAKLDRDTIYEKSDVYQMTGLSPSYPGLGHAMEAADKYYVRVGGRVLYSHPDTIKMLKDTAKMK